MPRVRPSYQVNNRDFIDLLVLMISLLLLNACVSHKNESSQYERQLYPHWIDADGDCQNARQELLIATSTKLVSFTNDQQCTVKSGQWFDEYTGNTYFLASDLDIDHIVPLAHAHYLGAVNWDRKKRQAFANDPDNLIAVDDTTNQEKSAKAPHWWMPPRKAYWCQYLIQWLLVKKKYQLEFSEIESTYIKKQLTQCELKN